VNNCYFIFIIWGLVYFFSSGINSIDKRNDYLAPGWLKTLGNPLSARKDVPLSIALLRVCNHIFFIASFVGYFFENDRNIYWKIAGAKYILIIIVAFLFSVIAEEIFVIRRKMQEKDKYICSNLFSICFSFLISLFIMYMYYKFLVLPNL